MKELRNIIFIFILYLVLCHIFLYKALIPNSSIFGTDHQTQSQTFSKSIEKEQEKNKEEFPYWTNHILGGMPTAASFFTHKPQNIDIIWGYLTYPVFALPEILAKVFNLSAADYNAIWWFSLFGFFMFLYLRKNGLSYFASFVGGLAFISCTGFISLFYPGHVTGKAYVIGFMPLIMMFISYGFEKRAAFFFFALSGFFLARTMIFHIQIFFLLCVLLLLYAVLKIIFDFYATKDWKRLVKFGALCCLLFLMPLVFNGDQLFPRMEFKKYTHRGAETPSVSGIDKGMENTANADLEKYHFVTSFSQPPEELLGMFMRYPFGMGKPYSGVLKEVESIPYYRGRFELRLSLEYVGVFVFLLSIIGLLAFRKQKEVILLLVIGLGSIILSMGKYTYLFDILYKLPGFRNFRIPLVYIMVSYVSFAALAGYGAQYLQTYVKSRDKDLFRNILLGMCGITVVLTILAATGSLFEQETLQFLVGFELVREMLWGIYQDIYQRYGLFMYNLYYLIGALWLFVILLFVVRKKLVPVKFMMVFLAVIIAVDLWTLNDKFLIPIPQKQNVQEYMSEDNLVKFLKQDKSYFRIKSTVDQINNRWLLHGISNIEGYHPTPLKNFEDVYSLMTLANSIDNLFNIKYLIVQPNDQLAQAIQGNVYLKKKYVKEYDTTSYFVSEKREKPVVVYRNTMDYGRAFFVYNYAVVNDDRQALMMMADPRFDPKNNAVLNQTPKHPLTLVKGKLAGLTFVKYTPNEVVMETDTDTDSLMIFSENWYPAWKGYIDGRQTEVLRAYNTLRAVFVPSGKHIVSFKYQSDTLLLGQIVFWAGLLSIIGALGYNIFRIIRARRQPA